jgi:predicted ATPase
MVEPPASVHRSADGHILAGREREIDQLRAAFGATRAGRGSLVLIGGSSGLGKTTLAEALLTEATAQGALVLIGRCYDLSETPPYGPWRELFDRAPRGDELPALPIAVLPPEREGEALSSQDAIIRRVQPTWGIDHPRTSRFAAR